jgi:esterase/lipase superfamily enzyme
MFAFCELASFTIPAAAQQPSALDPHTETVCRARDECAPIKVFFATDRARAPPRSWGSSVNFTSERGSALNLGRAMVTVPLQVVRTGGEIVLSPHKVFMPRRNRGQWWDVVYPALPGPNPAKHFTLSAPAVLDASTFIAELRKNRGRSSAPRRNILLFVHGYNTSFETALFRSGQMAYDIDGIDTIVAYSWPSAGGGLTLPSYAYDRESTEVTSQNLRGFIQLLMQELPSDSIHILANGLGGGPVMNALSDIGLVGAPTMQLGEIILLAPDMDADIGQQIIRKIQPLASGITIYASAADTVLRASQSISGSSRRLGAVGPGGPVILPGVETIDVSALSTDYFAVGHSSYAENRGLLSDVSILIKTRLHPPDARRPIYRRREGAAGVYWVLYR